MVKRILTKNEAGQVAGCALTYRGEALDMSMTVSRLNEIYPEIGIKGLVGNYWTLAKNLSLEKACTLLGGKAKVQEIIDKYEAEHPVT